MCAQTAPVAVNVAVAGSKPEDHVMALRNWLACEDELRGQVQPHRESPEPGQMGATVQLLTVALGSGGALAVLMQSLCTWLTSRGTDITITVSAADGRQIEVDVRRASDPQAVLREVSEIFHAADEQLR